MTKTLEMVTALQTPDLSQEQHLVFALLNYQNIQSFDLILKNISSFLGLP